MYKSVDHIKYYLFQSFCFETNYFFIINNLQYTNTQFYGNM